MRRRCFDVDSIGLTNVVDAPQSGHRHRRPADRPADRIPHRRGGEPRRAEPGRGGPPVPLQGRGGRGVRDHAAGVRGRRAGAVPGADRGRPHSDPRGHHAARQPAARRVHGQRSARASACRTPCSSGCGEADAAGRAATEGIAIAREVVSGIRSMVQGIQITTAAGAIEAALDVVETVEA